MSIENHDAKKVIQSDKRQKNTHLGYLCCWCEYVIHLGFTSLVQLRDGLFQSFIGIQIAKIGLDLIPLIFKGSRAIRYKI